MMPDLLDLDTYDFSLPQELIAQHPLKERSSSRLMVLERQSGNIEHRSFNQITEYFQSGDVLVMNSSKVIPARLFGKKDNGTVVEILLLHKISDSAWKCLVHPGKRLKQAQWLTFSEALRGFIGLADAEGARVIEFDSPETYWQEIEKIGHVPLPPYIRRQDESEDKARYQTVYAREEGSVAAPTAGLHFTEELLAALRKKGVSIRYVILHVGLGTFLPVKTQRITDHQMHSEYCTMPEETALAVNTAKKENRRVIAVGSTSLRTLESFAHDGVVRSGSKWTDIFIYPGKNITTTDALITNFHLPKSSLLMMISAFASLEMIQNAYQCAIQNRYRFFSYGDAMLIL
jgi:S-adenosylmethionine:tRNA ribosyltransferase-isomerase